MKALAGLRVLLTRPAESSSGLADSLRAAGATVSAVPLIQIAETSDPSALQVAADNADVADWLIFTSANGVASFARCRHEPLPARVHIAVVGPATAAAVQSVLRRPVDVIPERHNSEALATAFISHAKRGASIFVFHPEGGASDLPSRLRAAGYTVNAVAAYRTVPVPPADIAQHVSRADAIVLMSGSQARALALGLGKNAGEALRDKLVVAIGERTAQDARRAGVRADAIARDVTPDAVANALARGLKR